MVSNLIESVTTVLSLALLFGLICPKEMVQTKTGLKNNIDLYAFVNKFENIIL